MVEQANNQAPTLGLAHEQRHAYMIFDGTSTRNETNFSSCEQSNKEACN